MPDWSLLYPSFVQEAHVHVPQQANAVDVRHGHTIITQRFDRNFQQNCTDLPT